MSSLKWSTVLIPARQKRVAFSEGKSLMAGSVLLSQPVSGIPAGSAFQRAIASASIAPVVDPAGSSNLTIQCPPSLTLDKMNHSVERPGSSRDFKMDPL
jgi:hypothetical protein